MIEKIIPSRSALNCFHYIGKEDSVFIATNMGCDEPIGLAKEFALVNSLNPTKYEAIHIVLTLQPGEHLTDEQWALAVENALIAES